jgi:hypothetical protein
LTVKTVLSADYWSRRCYKDPATEKQASFLSKLAADKGVDVDTEHISKAEASEKIDELKKSSASTSGGGTSSSAPNSVRALHLSYQRPHQLRAVRARMSLQSPLLLTGRPEKTLPRRNRKDLLPCSRNARARACTTLRGSARPRRPSASRISRSGPGSSLGPHLVALPVLACGCTIIP